MNKWLIACLLLPSISYAEEFVVEHTIQKQSCASAVGLASRAGFEISPFDCVCDEIPGSPKIRCVLDSKGAKRIQPVAQTATSQKGMLGQSLDDAPLRTSKADCQALRIYRDGALKVERSRAQRSIAAARSALDLNLQERQKLEGSLEDQAAVYAAYKLLLVTKLTSTAIADVLKAYPPTERTMMATEKVASLTTRLILSASNSPEIVASPTEYMAKDALWRVPLIGNAAVGAVNLTQNLSELRDTAGEGEEAIDIAEAGLKRQELLIKKLNARFATGTARLRLLTRLDSDIHALCGRS